MLNDENINKSEMTLIKDYKVNSTNRTDRDWYAPPCYALVTEAGVWLLRQRHEYRFNLRSVRMFYKSFNESKNLAYSLKPDKSSRLALMKSRPHILYSGSDGYQLIQSGSILLLSVTVIAICMALPSQYGIRIRRISSVNGNHRLLGEYKYKGSSDN